MGRVVGKLKIMTEITRLKPDDFKRIVQIFLKEVRGSETQESLSEKLETSFNIFSRWENGARGFYWNDFVLLASLTGWNIAEALNDVIHSELSSAPESHQVVQLLAIPSARAVLEKEFSMQKVNRLAAGKSKLLFSDFLFMLELLFGRAQRFLNHFLTTHQQKSLGAYFSPLDKYCDLMAQDPRFGLLKILLSLNSYKSLPEHSDAFLEQILGLPEREIKRGLGILEDVGLIQKEGSKFVTKSEYVDTGARSRELSRTISSHFRNRISASVAESSPDVLSSYIVYGTNPELEEKVFELCKNFYMDVKNVVSQYEDKSQENVRYIGIDLFYPLGRGLK